jgi:hypothetical protein
MPSFPAFQQEILDRNFPILFSQVGRFPRVKRVMVEKGPWCGAEQKCLRRALVYRGM